MAGWLFADLLLVLFLVGIGAELTQASLNEPVEEPKVEQPQQEEKPPGMRQEPVKGLQPIAVDAKALLDSGDAAAKAEKKRMRGDLKEVTEELEGKRAGMVIVWGGSPDPNRGIALSEAVAEQLTKASKSVFEDAVIKPLWNGSRKMGPEGTVKLEIYMFDE